MIVGNVEEYIERCLKSFLPIADEICLVRAIGNSEPDATFDIAAKAIDLYRAPKGFGPKQRTIKFAEYKNGNTDNPAWQQWKNPGVTSQSWPHLDDFAAARNQAFNMATGKYIFWADSDDVLESGAEAIREDAEEGKWTVYIIPYRIFGRDVNIQRERMMRRGSGKWVYPVHECYSFDPIVEGALDERATVLHLPNVTKTGSNDRNLRILEAIPEKELTPGLKYHLHGELLGVGQLERAIAIGSDAVRCEELGVPERYEIFLNLGKLAKDKELTMQLFHQAFKLDPTRREALGLLTCTAMDHGLGKESMGYARAMMSLPPPEKPNWNDRNSAYDWLGGDIYSQAARYQGFYHSRNGDKEKAQKYLGMANKIRCDILNLAIKSGRPIISLIHATRGRPLLASKARKMWLDLADRPDAIEHIFIYAEDDEKSVPLSRMHHIVIPPGLGCVGAWNAGAAACHGDIIIQMSDDWVPPLQWDTQIIDRLREASIAIQDKVAAVDPNRQGDSGEPSLPKDFSFEPLVLAVNDGHRTDSLLCMAIETRRYYEQDNFMFHPRFFGVYSDNWFTREAYRRGQVVDARDLIFTHDHPFFREVNHPETIDVTLPGDPRPLYVPRDPPPVDLDETYKIQNDPKRYEQGKAIYDDLVAGSSATSHSASGGSPLTPPQADHPPATPADWSSIPGWFNYWQLYQLIAKSLNDGDVVAEVGVWLGRSIIFLAQECKRAGKKVKLLAIDNFQGEKGVPEHAEVMQSLVAAIDLNRQGGSGEPPLPSEALKGEFLKNIERCGVADMITLLEGDSIKVARQIPNNHLAFCFIDASHDYDNVRKDITAWTPKVKHNHCIAGHDAQWEGVQKAVLQRFPKAYINGPIWMAKA